MRTFLRLMASCFFARSCVTWRWVVYPRFTGCSEPSVCLYTTYSSPGFNLEPLNWFARTIVKNLSPSRVNSLDFSG